MVVWMIHRNNVLEFDGFSMHIWMLHCQWVLKELIAIVTPICCTCGLTLHGLTQVNKFDTEATTHSTWWAISNRNVSSVTRGSSVKTMSKEYSSTYNTKDCQRAKMIRNINSNIGRQRCEKTYLLITKRPAGCRPPRHLKASFNGYDGICTLGNMIHHVT